VNPYDTLRWIAKRERWEGTPRSLVRRRALTAAWALRPTFEMIHDDSFAGQTVERGVVAHEFDQTHAQGLKLLRSERRGFMLVTLGNVPPKVHADGTGELLTVHSCYMYGRRREILAFYSQVKAIADKEITALDEAARDAGDV